MEWRGDVAVVGGGASGALVTAALLRSSHGPLTIVWLDRTGSFGRGIAYATDEPSHVLNVPAGNMGADPTDVSGFLRWVRDRGVDADAHAFLPRGLYGEYLEDFIVRAERAHPESRVARLRGEAVDSVQMQEGLRLALRSGDQVHVRAVVLATGNLLPGPLPTVRGAENSVRNAWSRDALDGLGEDGEVLLVGTGLTAVDALLSLERRGHRGKIHALSLQGLFPRVHAARGPRWTPSRHTTNERRARMLIRRLREEVREVEARGGTWRDAVDALRPFTVPIWTALEEVERRRFLRHARGFWEVHRHRVAPEVWRVVEAMQARGQLDVLSGRLVSIEPASKARVAVRYRPRGGRGIASLEVTRVLNCTGPRPINAAQDEPLLKALLTRGEAALDPHGLGFRTEAGALLNRRGDPSRRLFALGPLRRGELWETTAIPEIRVQAVETARRVLDELEGVVSADEAAPPPD